jgi:hypothetical protein
MDQWSRKTGLKRRMRISEGPTYQVEFCNIGIRWRRWSVWEYVLSLFGVWNAACKWRWDPRKCRSYRL